MAEESAQSPLASEWLDELGSEVTTEGESYPGDERGEHEGPPEQEEDTDFTKQESAVDANPSPGLCEEAFPPPPPPDTNTSTAAGGVEEELNGAMTNMGTAGGEEEWPPMPTLQTVGEPGSKCHLPLPKQPLQTSLDSPEDSDSIVFLSEESEEEKEEVGVDFKPLNFTSTRDQWIRRDSGDIDDARPYRRSSSQSRIAEAKPNMPGHQQGEPSSHSLAQNSENQEAQQVCKSAPPLETVARETANPEPGGPTCSSIIVVRELLTETAGRREGERESEQTEGERKETVSSSGSAAAGGESQGETERLEENSQGCRAAVVSQRSQPRVRMDTDQFDDSQSDSGVSADFSPNGTTDIRDCATSTLCSFSESPEHPANETPIEKEIRLAIKREQSLRRSRGLDARPDMTKEFVEIPLKKAILSQELPASSDKSHGKDRQFAGKKMQQEIQMEVEREKALVKLGRLPGFYDKGTVRQLREKKRLFEAFQEPPAAPSSRPSSVSSCDGAGAAPYTNNVLASSKERTRSLELLAPEPNPSPPFGVQDAMRGPGLTEAIRGQVIILETTPSPSQVNRSQRSTSGTGGRLGTTLAESERARSVSAEPYRDGWRTSTTGRICNDDNEEESAMSKENPFFKLRSSLSLRPDVQQDIQQARDRERELRKQRSSLYGGGSGAENSPNTYAVSHHSTLQQMPKMTPTISTASVRQSLGKLDLTWPPPQTQDQHKDQPEKSPKARQRSVLLQRWESGLVNGHTDQQD